MRRQINNFISVIYSFLRFILFKFFLGNSLKFGLIERISPNVVLEFNKGSKVKFGKSVRIHSGSKIKVRKGGKLTIGNDVKINYYCIIACREQIEIGEGTEFGPSVYVYDHDHDYKKGLHSDSDKESFVTGAIKIGKNCWIGANTIILRGTTIGDNCVIGAGSVVKGSFEDGTVIIQKRKYNVDNGDSLCQ